MMCPADHAIYDALPISDDALDKGGVELLRAGVVDEVLLMTARPVFADPAHWGYVLADITRRLAALYAAESDFTEAKASAVIADAYARSLRAGAAREATKRRPAKSAPPRVDARAKSSTTTAARRKGRAKS